MLRRLKFEDREIVSSVLLPREVEFFKSTYLSGLGSWYAFGWFVDGKLTGISTAYHDSNSQEWYLLKQHADHAEDMKAMVPAMCKKFEDAELYRFTWLDTDHTVDFMKNFIPSEYNHYTEYAIPAFTLPKNLIHWNILMNNRFVATASRVHISVLPDEFRKI